MRKSRRIKGAEKRLVIISNRLPVSIEREEGQWRLRPSSGGLVSALAPVLRDRGGLWIGWPGTLEDVDLDQLLQASPQAGYGLKAVTLTPEERDKFYYGFSNEIIWPLFHALHTVCNFDPEYWTVYRAVNRKFADVVSDNVQSNDFLWVHDYHLMLLAQELKKAKIKAPVGFFLHIPFPPPDIFLKLPWRTQIIDALLDYDFVGFQTSNFRQNFVQCVRALEKQVTVSGKNPFTVMTVGQREVRLGNFPISIDFEQFASQAASEEVAEMAWSIRERLPDRELMIGVDRLDYTKGLPYKLDGFRLALERYEELRTRISLIQVVVPSREEIPPYHDLRAEVERLVGKINGEFTESGWVPIHYIFRHLDRDELLALYRTAGIALLTPLEDGMNLVAKEYCASSLDDEGVLILSEFTGTAEQMRKNALLVNPYDRDQMADTIYQAYKMPMAERRSRMRKLRRSVQEQDIFWWVDSFLKAAASSDLDAFPPRADEKLEEIVEYR